MRGGRGKWAGRIPGGERLGSGGGVAGEGHGAEPPAPGEIRPFSFPEVASGELDNGLQTRVAHLPRIPMTTATVVLNAGESWLSDDRAGLAVVAGDCLEGGTEKRSGAELAEALESLGADLSVSTGWDSTTVSLSCHADRLSAAFALLAEVIREPSFPEEEVARVRNQQLATLAQRKMVPSKLAVDHALRAIYAEGIPFGRPVHGVSDAVEGMDPDSARSFVDEAYRPGDGGLVVAGDVDEAEIRELAGEHLGEWTGEARGRPDFDVEPRDRERRIVVVDRPGSVQSELRMGHVGIRRTSDDYFSLLVFNALLGGTFTSRLNQRLREERGFTYGVRSRFSTRRLPGPFLISTAVETAVTADAVGDIMEVLDGVLEEGPTQKEVESARDYIVGVFPLRFETTSQVSSRVAELIVYGLPDDYHATYRDRIREVTPESALEAARRNVLPEEMAVVIVGAADEVRGPLEELNLGPVEVVTP